MSAERLNPGESSQLAPDECGAPSDKVFDPGGRQSAGLLVKLRHQLDINYVWSQVFARGFRGPAP